MDKLGEYITEEYGLLKEILLNLPGKDLLNARKVCRSWLKVVDVILAEGNRPFWWYSSGLNHFGHPVNNIHKIIPEVILYHSNKSVRSCEELDCCPCKLRLDCTNLFLFKDVFTEKDKACYDGDGYDFIKYSSSMLALPSMPGVEINKIIVRKQNWLDVSNLQGCQPPGIPGIIIVRKQNWLDEVTDEELDQVIGTEPIKCLLVYSPAKTPTRNRMWLQRFLKKVADRHNGAVAIGGGDAVILQLFQGKCQCHNPNISFLFVTLRGDNVTAHSQVLTANTKEGIDTCMKEMAENVGSVPSGSERIALVYTCVNRYPGIDLDEGQSFKRAFPNIPHFGFISFGEYGISTISDNNMKKRKTSTKVVHTDSTSFVILTFHNLPTKKVILEKTMYSVDDGEDC